MDPTTIEMVKILVIVHQCLSYTIYMVSDVVRKREHETHVELDGGDSRSRDQTPTAMRPHQFRSSSMRKTPLTSKENQYGHH